MHALTGSAAMTVRQMAGSLLLLSWELIVCFKVKVRYSVAEPPAGVFNSDLHWCCNIVVLLCVLYGEIPG